MTILKADTSMTRIARIASQTTLAFLLAGLLVVTGGCAATNNRDEDTRGASLLVLDSLTSGDTDENDDGDAFIFSDVCDGSPGFCSVANDNGVANFRNVLLSPLGEGSYYQDITLYRYHVQYTRSDGQNVEGIDVPFAFDSVMSSTVGLNDELEVGFLIVRHVAKVERPLVDLVGLGDEFILSTNTRVDFYGRDLAGNEHQVHGWIDIEFGDYGEDD